MKFDTLYKVSEHYNHAPIYSLPSGHIAVETYAPGDPELWYHIHGGGATGEPWQQTGSVRILPEGSHRINEPIDPPAPTSQPFTLTAPMLEAIVAIQHREPDWTAERAVLIALGFYRMAAEGDMLLASTDPQNLGSVIPESIIAHIKRKLGKFKVTRLDLPKTTHPRPDDPGCMVACPRIQFKPDTQLAGSWEIAWVDQEPAHIVYCKQV